MRKILMLIILLPFLVACGSVPLSNETNDITIDIAASTIGYLTGKENPEKIGQWIEWGNKLLEIMPGLPVDLYEKLLAIGFNMTTNDPFLRMQLIKLVRLLDLPELQPPESTVLLEKYVEKVKLIIAGFLDGLYVVQAKIDSR